MSDPLPKQRGFRDPQPNYGESCSLFTIKFHVFGLLRIVNGEYLYSGGSVYYWDFIDRDLVSTIEMDKMVQNFMISSKEFQHFYRATFEDGKDCLLRVANDVECRKMLKEIRNGIIEVYIISNNVIETIQHGPNPLIRMDCPPFAVAVVNCDMEEKQIFQNVQMSVNFLVSLLKKNWQNVKCLHLKSTMRKPNRVF